MNAPDSSPGLSRGSPEASLRAWLEEHVASPEERARIADLLEGGAPQSAEEADPADEQATPDEGSGGRPTRRQAAPRPPDAGSELMDEVEAVGQAAPGQRRSSAWDVAQSVLRDYASLREQMWRKLEPVPGVETDRLIPLASHIESAIDEMVAFALERHLREYEDQLHEEAATDSLTGLPGRGLLMERLHGELSRAQRYDHPFAILFIDVDGLKSVNDTSGHSAGDQALRQLAGTLRMTIRSADVLGRYGGDEFICLLPETSVDGARIMAGRIVQAVATASRKSQGRLTISVGVAAYPEAGSTVGELLQVADSALYHVKAAGGNGYGLPSGEGFTVVPAYEL